MAYLIAYRSWTQLQDGAVQASALACVAHVSCAGRSGTDGKPAGSLKIFAGTAVGAFNFTASGSMGGMGQLGGEYRCSYIKVPCRCSSSVTFACMGFCCSIRPTECAPCIALSQTGPHLLPGVRAGRAGAGAGAGPAAVMPCMQCKMGRARRVGEGDSQSTQGILSVLSVELTVPCWCCGKQP